MKLESLSRQQILKTMEREFGYSGHEQVTKLGALSEHIRAAVFIESQWNGEGNPAPVATATVTRTVRQRLSPVWPELVKDEQSEDPVLDSLSHLARLGEMMKVDSSHWVSAPVRLIAVDDTTSALIAATPLHALPFPLRKVIQITGRARLVDTTGRHSATTVPVQRLADWMRCAHGDVCVWARAFMQQGEKNMLSVEDLDGVELFLAGRWQPPGGLTKPPHGVQLYRRKVLIHGTPSHEYGLCRLRATGGERADIERALVIDRQDARRLQGALPQASGLPQTIKYQRDADLVTLFLPRPLPAPENAFLSLGWPCGDHAPEAWPKKYVFSARLIPLLQNAIELLGYRLIEQSAGE
ncbi:hypothetical protein B0G76_7486 [Paraburkholderia sp. BL23I1N1]|uniref:hypothetical protein n=1 Tax=Paraburkholderia sp. BL23I1N1 TaxID=1938802 RepID=UPI000E7090EF|nr:hypothetical protein [Paraburkholderia sp. BL23I1N1]RKE25912.1 hypothetical protein B0G76_7486 [Paraburkholderia sp. BL23I1N1]